jgi:hypothetical protein
MSGQPASCATQPKIARAYTCNQAPRGTGSLAPRRRRASSPDCASCQRPFWAPMTPCCRRFSSPSSRTRQAPPAQRGALDGTGGTTAAGRASAAAWMGCSSLGAGAGPSRRPVAASETIRANAVCERDGASTRANLRRSASGRVWNHAMGRVHCPGRPRRRTRGREHRRPLAAGRDRRRPPWRTPSTSSSRGSSREHGGSEHTGALSTRPGES